MHLCRSQLHLPYMKIAEIFSRDHSTVMTSVKLIDKRLQDNPSIQDSIKTILQELQDL
jgi:chromosomal replication initiator protein